MLRITLILFNGCLFGEGGGVYLFDYFSHQSFTSWALHSWIWYFDSSLSWLKNYLNKFFFFSGHSHRACTLGLVYTRERQPAALGYACQPGQAEELRVPDLANKNREYLVKLEFLINTRQLLSIGYQQYCLASHIWSDNRIWSTILFPHTSGDNDYCLLHVSKQSGKR